MSTDTRAWRMLDHHCRDFDRLGAYADDNRSAVRSQSFECPGDRLAVGVARRSSGSPVVALNVFPESRSGWAALISDDLTHLWGPMPEGALQNGPLL